MDKSNHPNIILSGGGTGGSVTPLLAVAAELFKEDQSLNFIFIGSRNGPEKELVSAFSQRVPMDFQTIPAGKFRRYFSFSNFSDLFKIIFAFFASLKIIIKNQPDLIMTAGSFISVPLVWAASFLKVPALVHQQDIRPGLANKLMAPFARAITISFEKSFADYGSRAIWTGNPTAEPEGDNLSRSEILKKYNLQENRPVVMVVGGGTGSLAINELVIKSLPELVNFCQIIHLTGKGKIIQNDIHNQNYHAFEILPHEAIMLLMSAADLVISRCGLGALTALSYLRKPAILIPMPDSHQEDNAAVFADSEASLVVSQKNLTAPDLLKMIRDLLNDKERLEKYSNNIGRIMKSRAAENVAALVWEIVGPKEKI